MESSRFCSVSESISGLRLVCFSCRKHGRFSLSLTDAADVWTKDFTDAEIEVIMHKLSLKTVDDFCQNLSSAELQLDLQEDSFRLSISGSNPVVLDLTKMATAAAAEEVKQLLFKMADILSHSSESGSSSTQSQTKQLHQRTAEFEPRKQNSTPLVLTKKRLPGSSLINPGTKKKREATGVAFDDPDDS